jgi:RNA polymerase sigma-70 factor (ECF subfamily)
MKKNIARTIPTQIQKAPAMPETLAERMEDAYPELRRIAAHFFQQERVEHTLQPTALVHETFIRLCGHGPKKYANHAHFFGVISRAMRQILVEHARGRGAQKRGGGWHRVVLEEADGTPAAEADLLALDAALDRLSALDGGLSRIAELRIFGGFSTREIASIAHRGESTVRRDWSIAKAWLQRDVLASGTSDTRREA